MVPRQRRGDIQQQRGFDGGLGLERQARVAAARAVDDSERSVSGITADRERLAYDELFHGHFRGMVRLAALLGAGDPEDVAQEAFCRLHERMPGMRDPGAAIGYLRTTVVNLTRSGLRHLQVVRRHAPAPMPDGASAEYVASVREEHREVIVALRGLAPRYREALVLRYWQDMSESEMAEVMGVSPGTVKSSVSRGLAALETALKAGGRQ